MAIAALQHFRGFFLKLKQAQEADFGPQYDRTAWLMACERHRCRLQVLAFNYGIALQAAWKAGASPEHIARPGGQVPPLPPLPAEPPMPQPVKAVPAKPPRFDLAAWIEPRADTLCDTSRLRVIPAQNGADKLHARGFSAEETEVLSQYHQAIINWLATQFVIVRHHSMDVTI